mmetsp:Transcript_12284/g.15805  ORF Transcript_12284/g.15805 Transcript_12284/m.15805 type:complete len:525 (-) Transcript_12284:202-1776(-)
MAMLNTFRHRQSLVSLRLFSGFVKPIRPSYGLWIDGKEDFSNGETIPVHNPATGDFLTEVTAGSADDINRAVKSAKTSFENGCWSKLPPRHRAKVLNRAAELLTENMSELAKIESLTTGRTLREYQAQLGRVPDWFVYHGQLASVSEGSCPPFSDEDHACTVRRQPLGVCALITPWNHPLLIAVKKVAVALATGNSVVVKPPELAPVSVLELGRILKEAGLPDGVYNVVNGFGDVAGSALASHKDISKVDFTGGTSTGKVIAKQMEGVKHYCAELGGNCPVVVFPDADILEAVNGVAFGAFVASGQTCVSAKRILIHESIFDEFVSMLVTKANGLKLGDPMDVTTHMGPVISQRQLEILESQVNRSLSEGAVALAGGQRPSPSRCSLSATGYFFEPTVLGNMTTTNTAFQEELFGPVVSVTPFKDEKHALELANDSPYGLGCAIWTSNVKVAHRLSRDIQSGVIWINAHHRNDPSAPWGGFKESGIGRENGLESHLEYTEPKTVVFRLAENSEDWFGDVKARYS